jgi:hypothetical protein
MSKNSQPLPGRPYLCGLHRSAKRHAAFAEMALSPHLPNPPDGMPGLGPSGSLFLGIFQSEVALRLGEGSARLNCNSAEKTA